MTTSYSGRTVDLLLLQFIPMPTSETQVTPSVISEPRVVSGIEKLVQRYALLFLTQLGSVKNRESEGTEFLRLLGTGHIYDENTLRAYANSANVNVVSQIRQEDADMDTAEDEALSKAEISAIAIDRSTATVSVTVTITAKSGDSYTYITPLTTGL